MCGGGGGWGRALASFTGSQLSHSASIMVKIYLFDPCGDLLTQL